MTELPDDLGLGLRTDLMLLHGSARIEVRSDAVAVVSPGNPDFYLGNVLMLRTEPAIEAIPMWRDRFADRVGRNPGIQHESFAWCARGAGDRHLAVVHERPAAALGLFLHAGIGRFQEVLTDARFRRRGLCSALVYGAAVQAGTQGARRLVMVADPSSAAIGLYRTLGFRDIEEVITACKVS